MAIGNTWGKLPWTLPGFRSRTALEIHEGRHDPVEGATMMIGSIAFTLEPVGSVPPDMVRVPAGTVQLGSRPPRNWTTS